MSKQFLTFVIENTTYAFEINRVQEVLEYVKPVKIPCAASYIEGLINSRNQGITLVNLRLRFGLEPQLPTKKTRIVVLELPDPLQDDEQHKQLFGVVADSVNEVITLEESEIEAAPKIGNSISPEYITGLANYNNGFVSLLNPERIFTGYTELNQNKQIPAEENSDEEQ